MPKNPYFDDDEDEDYFEEEQEDLAYDSPETYVSDQQGEEYPPWANITSDLAEEPPNGFESVSESNIMADQVISNPILRPSRPSAPETYVEPIPVPIPVPSGENQVEQDLESFEGVPIPIPAPIETRKTQNKPKMMPRERTESSPEVPRSSRYVDEREEEPRRRRPLRESQPSDEEYDYSREEVDDEEDYYSSEDNYSPPKRKTNSRRQRQKVEVDEEIFEDEEDFEDRDKNKRKGLLTTKKKSSSKNKFTKKDKSSEKEERAGKYAGGRGRVLVLRGVVWLAIGLVLFLGVRQVFFPPTPSIPVVAEQVAEELGITDFPEILGGSLALEFASVYLNYDPSNESSLRERNKQILSYLPSSAIPKDGLTFRVDQVFSITGNTRQIIIDGPFLTERPTLFGNSGFFVVAATIANVRKVTNEENLGEEEYFNEKRIYLTVPIIKDELGRVAVGGAPGFTPGQARAEKGDPFVLAKDAEATNSFAAEIPNLFTAWGKSDSAGLGRYLAPDADEVTRTGLNGVASYSNYRNLVVQEVEDPFGYRYATVDIEWNMDDNIFTQQYLLIIYGGEPGGDRLWFVSSIRPGLSSLE